MTRDNAYADVEKQYLGGGLPPSPSIGTQYNRTRDDRPEVFHTMSTVYDHINSVHQHLLEVQGMLAAVSEKIDGSSPGNPTVERSRAEPMNVVEALEQRVADLESSVGTCYQFVSNIQRRI
jgi:hypothetical protein